MRYSKSISSKVLGCKTLPGAPDRIASSICWKCIFYPVSLSASSLNRRHCSKQLQLGESQLCVVRQVCILRTRSILLRLLSSTRMLRKQYCCLFWIWLNQVWLPLFLNWGIFQFTSEYATITINRHRLNCDVIIESTCRLFYLYRFALLLQFVSACFSCSVQIRILSSTLVL